MEKPLVSVVIPCYNQGQFLLDCLSGVKAQTYKNIEIIIINDGSSDIETTRIINNLSDPQIRIINKENGGLSSARNAGINTASGEFILPLDADDRIGETYIEKAVAIFNSDPFADVVFCKGQFFGSESGPMNNEYHSFRSQLLYNSIFPACIYRKEQGITAGLYNTNMKKGMEDWDFLVRLLAGDKKVIQIREVLFYYRRTKGSMWDSLSKASEAKIEMENRLFLNNADIYMKQWGSIIEVLREYEILKSKDNDIDAAEKRIYNTFSYRIGTIFLYPAKLIKKIIRF